MSTPSLDERLAEIERRLARLEKFSHPPVDLTAPVFSAMAEILGEAAEVARSRKR